MKITKSQLRQIIKEELKEELKEGFKETEIELIENIVVMLHSADAIIIDDNDPNDNGYAAAYEYLKDAVLPTLKDWAQ